jgi:hypothetical protein
MAGNATGAPGWNRRVCASALTGGRSGHQPKKCPKKCSAVPDAIVPKFTPPG